METAKFTKGKWSILNSYHEENKKWICIFLEENTDISIDISCDLDDDNNNELEANSLLISKAPEMLEMLKLLVDRLVENDLGDLSATKRAEQLIKEATEL